MRRGASGKWQATYTNSIGIYGDGGTAGQVVQTFLDYFQNDFCDILSLKVLKPETDDRGGFRGGLCEMAVKIGIKGHDA